MYVCMYVRIIVMSCVGGENKNQNIYKLIQEG